MSAEPQTAEPYPYLRVVMEPPSGYDVGERRPEPVDAGGGFTQVDNAAILDTKLSLNARMLYVVLRQHRNGGSKKCCPSYERLQELLGTVDHPAAKTTVAKALQELRLSNLVAWERHGRFNTYIFSDDPRFASALAGTYAAEQRGAISKNAGNYGWQVMVERRDGGKCVLCGHSPADRHHIIPRREHGPNLPENVVTLCPNHHGMAGRGEISREELLSIVRERSSTGLLQERSSDTLPLESTETTPAVAHGYSNNMKLTRRIEQHDPAPAERGAPRAEPAPEKARTPKRGPSAVEAKPQASTNVPRKRAGADATPAGYELMAWWCEQTDNRPAGDMRRRVALGADELLRKAGDEAEARAFIEYRIARGWACDLRFLAEKYLKTWRNNAGGVNGASNGATTAGTRGPDQTGRPGRNGGDQGGPGGTEPAAQGTSVSEWVKHQRDLAKSLMAAQEGRTVPGVPVRDA